MSTVRKHGSPPYRVVVVHGGPGAEGGLGPVAEEISRYAGVLEPVQGADSVNGQVEELHEVISLTAAPPVCLVGHSWGAWLAWMYAAAHPELVAKLVLVGSGAFETKYALEMDAVRMGRLSEADRLEVLDLVEKMTGPPAPGEESPVARLGRIFEKADNYDPLPAEEGRGGFDQHIFDNVWSQAQELRRSGELLAMAGRIRCPVVAVHGDYDPHPAEGVRGPLSRVLTDFRFILLEKCGHSPWKERFARERFFDILHKEIS